MAAAPRSPTGMTRRRRTSDGANSRPSLALYQSMMRPTKGLISDAPASAHAAACERASLWVCTDQLASSNISNGARLCSRLNLMHGGLLVASQARHGMAHGSRPGPQ